MKFSKIFILLIFIFFFNPLIQAQNNSYKEKKQKEITIDTIDVEDDDEDDLKGDTTTVIPDGFDNSLDEILYSWAVDKKSSSPCVEMLNPETTSEQYKERLAKLPHVIEMPYNSVVKSFIELYTTKGRTQLEYMLGLSKYYFPIFEDALSSAGLPLELKYLPVIESALNPTAKSRAGAGGLWQFMISTGRMYSLEINSLVDDRFDPRKSTKAAIAYLKDLNSIYDDWNFTIAAYNCGPGNVNKAIRRAGGKRDFWAIYPYLPKETRGYLPIFIAANYAMTYYQEHNLCPKNVRMPAITDTIVVHDRINLEQISSVLNIPIDELRILNPQYGRDVVPGDIKPYSICLPTNFANDFIDKEDDIIAYQSEIFNDRREEVAVPEVKAVTYRGRITYHKVRKGESLGAIARKYHVRVSQLKRWNRLKSSTIKAGQRLKIERR